MLISAQSGGTPQTSPSQAETLLGATLFLMLNQCRAPDAGAARIIAEHLAMIAAHEDLAPTLRRVCGQMLAQWRDRHGLQHPQAQLTQPHSPPTH